MLRSAGLILNNEYLQIEGVTYAGTNPQFVEGDVFRITIPLAEVATATVGPSSNGAINGAINLTDSEQRVLEALMQNPHVTRKELVAGLGIGDGTVSRAIQKLKAEHIIERIGSNQIPRCKQRGIKLATLQSSGVFDPRGIRQLAVQARPLGSLLAGIKPGTGKSVITDFLKPREVNDTMQAQTSLKGARFW